MTISSIPTTGGGLFSTGSLLGARKSEDQSVQTTKAPDAKAEFLKLAEMTPAERMRAAILKKVGLTEEELAAMSPTERQAVEDQIAQKIKDEILGHGGANAKTGQLADLKV